MPHWSVLLAQAGVMLAVLALGLSASFEDAIFVLRRPAKLARALLSMNVVVPLFTAAMVSLFHLREAVAIALLTLAVSPIPPILPRRVLKAGGGAAYTIGLLVAVSLFAIAIVPLGVRVLGGGVSPLAVARVIAISVVVPLAVGVLGHDLVPRFAERIARTTSILGLVLVAAGALPILVGVMPAALQSLGDGTLIAILAFNVVGLLAGHLLGGPEREERTVLAFTSASRHPGVALVVAAANVPDPKPVAAALVLYLIVNALVTAAYVVWSKRHAPRIAHGAAS